jgi:hypothetical protein
MGWSAFFARTRRTFARANTSVNYGTYTISEAATGEYPLNTQFRKPADAKSDRRQNQRCSEVSDRNDDDWHRREIDAEALARMITADPQFGARQSTTSGKS